MSQVSAVQWNALVSPNDPFTRHEFLLALEDSGSVGEGTGWVPCHLLVQDEEGLVAALPLYLKSHSYGEYIFDWAWASAAQRAGINYFPKLLGAVPFTPATGRRILTGEHPLDDEFCSAITGELESLAQQIGAPSFHLLFVTEEEQKVLSQQEGLIGRITHQYHWDNKGYAHFESWLTTFRSRRRKEVHRERTAAKRLGVEISVLRGDELKEQQWQAIEYFYGSTIEKKGAYPYLTPAFFKLLKKRLSHLVLALVAEHQGEPVAMSLCFQQGESLYGRYWGCDENFRSLHFELCYHRPIELCIQNGWTHFEAGAQGPHKIRRGLLPAATYSVHWIAHPSLRTAVQRAVEIDNEQQQQQIHFFSERGPFRRCQP